MNIDLNAIEARAKAATTVVFIGVPMRKENLEFLEHAKDDVSALLAEVERLNIVLQDERKEHAEEYARLRSTYIREAKRLESEQSSVTAERDAAVRHMKIIADTYRENVGDDGICGLCEYDAYHGIEGYANECPGFESNECFSWRGAGKEQNDG